MPDIEQRVARHYGAEGLMQRIRAGLTALGSDPDAPRADDLKPIDEFHIGGVAATDRLLDPLDIGPATRVLDIGAGLGGTARHVAGRFGAHVTGVDLTPEYVQAAQALSTMAGFGARNAFVTGSALELPVADGGFDLALMLHVGMNIEDKARLMREARRVLRRGGVFAVYDVMRGPNGAPLTYPVPWAAEADTSFVAPLDAYTAAATAAGFERQASTGRRDVAIDFLESFRQRVAQSGPPPLGIHLLMGDTAAVKIANMLAQLKDGRIEPTELVLRAV